MSGFTPLKRGADIQEAVVVVDVVVALTFPHRYNAARGHRTGSDTSGAEDCLRRKNR